MIEPATPENEDERLAALRALGVLDTAPERIFDDIVAVARAIFGTSMAHIPLIDKDRQWLKARVGHDIVETPRDVSFCAHAILRDDALVVPDAREDPRFHDNPYVEGEGLRFYVGQPLRVADGAAIGTLCVADLGLRDDPTQAQLDALAALARLTVEALLARKRDAAK
ncbi:MAG: GAF domain-containing protein [Alphaproteobacteria bacterium]|nr:GAF domain-containing protein [Alphaproteobacteria bacterium]